ncbi:MAG: hypothetical protein ACRENP_14820 [Longimicrobiales bacterium]
MTAAAELLTLRQTLERRFPNAQPLLFRTAGAVATGLGGLDALLPGGGLPRGRVTLWLPGGGATAVLRASSRAVLQRGERSAWIDAQRQVSGDGWVRGPLLIRPTSEVNALACAEELLRSGGFTLVVLTGVVSGVDREAVRLSRAAREGGSALVALANQASVAHLRVVTHIQPDGYQWKLNPFGEPTHVESVRIRVEANAMGWNGHTELILPVHTHAQRSAADPLLRDRRGAYRRHDSAWKGRPSLLATTA